jgi:RNA 3'-terminal phosphate cyclase (ATP)
MLIIDGSRGEGGGQILRTALSLSLLTQIPFRIERIRAGRAAPGLSRQHLLAVVAAMRIGGAHVEGAEFGLKRSCFGLGL